MTARSKKPAVVASSPARDAVMRASTPPNGDPFFFHSLRSQIAAQGSFDKPYAQSPYAYAPIRARAAALSQVPFVLLKWDRKAMATGETFDRRIKGLKRHISKAPDEILAFVAHIHRPAERFRAIRSLAPWLSVSQVRAIALDDAIEVESGPWYDLFRKPNPDMTRAQLWEATFTWKALDGGLFWAMESVAGPVLKPDEVPTRIYPEAYGDWRANVDKRRKKITGWYRKGENPNTALDPSWQITRWYSFNPYSQIDPLSPLTPAMQWLRSDYKAQVFNEAFFDNGARIGGTTTTDKSPTPQQRKEFLEQFEERHSGSRKRGRPSLLWDGLKYTPNDQTHREMEFTKLTDHTRDILSLVTGTPKIAMGQMEDVNLASALMSLRAWWEGVLLPELAYAEDLTDSHVFTEERAPGLFGVFDTSSVVALRDNMSENVDAAKKLWDMGATLNDLNQRFRLGLPETEGGDTGWRPQGLVPTNMPWEDTRPPASVPPEPPPAKEAKAITGAPAIVVIRADKSESEIERHRDRVITELLEPASAQFASRMKAFLFRLRNAQLKLITDADSIGAVEPLLFSIGEWRPRFIEDSLPLMKRWTRAGDRFAAEEIDDISGAGKAVSTDEELDSLSASLADKASISVTSLRRSLRNILATLFETDSNETTKEEIITAVKAFFAAQRSGERALVVGTWEAGVATSTARFKAWDKRGIETHVWSNSHDELVRHTHIEYGDAGPKKIGFNWASVINAPYVIRHPHDSSAPLKEVIHCRCAAVPLA